MSKKQDKRQPVCKTTLQDVVNFILRANCPDCFHPECREAVDLAEAVINRERGDR